MVLGDEIVVLDSQIRRKKSDNDHPTSLSWYDNLKNGKPFETSQRNDV